MASAPKPAASSLALAGARERRGRGMTPETAWGLVFILPYVAVFLFFVIYPVSYGLWLGSGLDNLRALFSDPLYYRTVFNTLVMLLIGVNLKMFISLLLSGYLMQPYRWMPFVFMLVVLPWAMPAIPTFISARWMLNGQWGLINNVIWEFWQVEGPGWLTTPSLALSSVVTFYIWKWVPFWTVIFVAGRTAIPKELYEAAAIDGASGLQMFRFVTFPMMASLYLICTVLSMIWTLGDYNTVRFISGGGPVLSTHVLATLGIRDAFEIGNPALGMSAVVSALPLLVPLVAFLIWKMNKQQVQL